MTHLHHGGRRARPAGPGRTRQARHRRRARRLGAIVIEAFVALTLLTTVLSVAVPLVVRHGRLLADCRSYRLALDELSNQLDRLSALPADELAAALQQLRPSELTASSLPGATLTSQLDSADIGVRLTLRISWGEPQRPTPPLRAREGTRDREKIAFVTGPEWHDAPRRASPRGEAVSLLKTPCHAEHMEDQPRESRPVRGVLSRCSLREQNVLFAERTTTINHSLGATCHTARNLSLVAWVLPTPPATIEPARPEEAP